jgi:undecaprenyl diphosphate synthase
MRIPEHLGIIPDGNRRWAENKGLNKKDGYEYGLMPGLEVLKMAIKIGVKEITYYGFTCDNCKRPHDQIVSFVKACSDAVNLIASESVSLLVLGNTESKIFPAHLSKYNKRIDIGNGGIKVNFLVNYGWEWDLSEIGFNMNNNKNSKIIDNLKSKEISKIDMIIRWGGRRRLSGFLPIQSVYSDLYVVEDMWPDFKTNHFENAIKWYNKQDITRGG